MTTGQVRAHKSVRSLVAGLVLMAALPGLAAVAIPTAPAARADAVDNAFLTAVKAKGINFASPQAAIIAGHEVCDELDEGKQKSDVASEVMTNSQLDGYHAGFFVGASVAAYCPRFHTSQ
jgi:hypothetical protein